MTVRVAVEPALLDWARVRSRLTRDALLAKFPAIAEWESGAKQPTLKQLESFARATHTPIGYLLLAEPPEEHLPLPDFRTIGDAAFGQPSSDLLDTIYECQQRQEWYREYAQMQGEPPVDLVGTLTTATATVDAAGVMRSALAFDRTQRGASWSDAFRALVGQAEQQGILVMVNGVVGSNTHRKLDPAEFRGFALCDEFAPLVFVNGADTKAAQIFTLAHEIAHVWLGQSAVSDADVAASSTNDVERWCNQVAAEFLLALDELRDVRVDDETIEEEAERLAHAFKVSTLVAIRRLFDGGHLTERQYRAAYASERDRVLALIEERGQSGGNFYNTQPMRVSRRFAQAIIESTLEGHTLHRDAFRMLGFKKQSTFDELAHRLGVV